MELTCILVLEPFAAVLCIYYHYTTKYNCLP